MIYRDESLESAMNSTIIYIIETKNNDIDLQHNIFIIPKKRKKETTLIPVKLFNRFIVYFVPHCINCVSSIK
jgi:hypothetical protein